LQCPGCPAGGTLSQWVVSVADFSSEWTKDPGYVVKIKKNISVVNSHLSYIQIKLTFRLVVVALVFFPKVSFVQSKEYMNANPKVSGLSLGAADIRS